MFDDRITTFEHECFNPIWREAGVIPDQYQLIEDGQLYGAWRTNHGSLRWNKDCEKSGDLCGDDVGQLISSLFLSSSTQIRLGFQCYIVTACWKLLSLCLVVLFVYPVASVCIVSKHQRAILVIGFLSSRIVILWSTILRMLSMFLTWKIFLVKISHYSHVEERKGVFYPRAICKAIVPNTFRIFLSQWRCYINSTIHSPAEPVLAWDLYGNLCSRYLAAWLAKSKSMTVLLGTLKTLSSRSWRHVFFRLPLPMNLVLGMTHTSATSPIWESEVMSAAQYHNDVPLAVFGLIMTMSKACRSS